jgi:hypothetical protein
VILSELSHYLAEHRRVELTDLAHHFEAEPEALRPMLAALERKGRARRLPTVALCNSGCGKCAGGVIEIYEWIGRAEG